MADIALTTEPRLDLNRVVRDTLAITGKRPVFVLGLAFLLSGLPSFLWPHAHGGAGFHPAGLLFFLVSMFLNAFLSASLYRLSVSELEGETLTPSEVFATAGRLFLPLFAVSLLLALAVASGMILLIVPGVMIGLAWCVAGPALVIEQTGITQSFSRSAQLTRNNRWRLLGLFVLFALAAAFAEAIFAAVGFAVSLGSDALFSGPRLLGSAILATLITALTTPGIAAVYFQLRELKAG